MSGFTPNASLSRFSGFMHRSQSPASEQRSLLADTDAYTAAELEYRSPASRPRGESIAGIGIISTSLKTPARSYYQRSLHGSHAPSDIHYSSSQGVREDTAELASRALSESSGTPPRNPPLRTHPSGLSTLDLGGEPSSRRDANRPRSSESSSRPGIIPEVSEPASPAFMVSPHGKTTSVLTQMIRNSPPEEEVAVESGEDSDDGTDEMDFSAVTVNPGIISQPREVTSLLHRKAGAVGSGPGYRSISFTRDPESLRAVPPEKFRLIRHALVDWKGRSRKLFALVTASKSWDKKDMWRQGVMYPMSLLPAVLLGLLLNILDALSYGMILFPLGQPVFADLGPDGISMFYVSCIISQLVYSLGGSVFRGGVGSEMIEVVPFFHKMAFTIIAQVGEDNPKAVLATTVLSYSLSSVLTGLVFFLLGQCKLGSLIGFFPRHILIGCIGGVGFFLVATGVEVSARLDGNLEYNLATLKKLFEDGTLALWTIPLALAITLLVLKRWIKHSLADAAWFVSVIIIFYIVVAAIPSLNIDDLRSKGWVFEAPAAGAPWYHFYSLYDFGAVDWKALVSTIPAMFALTFFGVLHVPINIPALGISTGEDNVDVDRELKAHGYSNALSGLVGSIQNYLVYTNTVLFMRSGGDSRFAGVLLAAATSGILVIGPSIIGFIPVMVVGTLIFFLGLDLMREALVDTIGRVHRLEYFTIVVIVVTMGAYDFVVGILAGIVLACVSFVLQTSQISAIRGTIPGGVASSTVRRHPTQHRFLQEVGRQIYVMKLAGYLFFGTIVGVEKQIRHVLRDDSFNSQPIQFLVLDLSKVDGVDFSAAEAFTRINRVLIKRDVELILSGFSVASDIGKSLHNVGLLDANDGVEFFESLNPALEYCENQLLKAFYQRKEVLARLSGETRFLDVPESTRMAFPDDLTFNSPRRGQLHQAATTMLREQQDSSQRSWNRYDQPLQLVLQTFANLSDKDEEFWRASIPYFKRKGFKAGTVVYASGDKADGFYLLETGILKAKYRLPQGHFSEVIVAGATCGELPFFSDTHRTSTTFAERDCVAWVLDAESWKKVQATRSDIAQELLKIGLKLTSERMEVITKYMLLTGT